MRRALRVASQVAILIVLCKPLWVEGYRIPSPSMQPTLMGPDAAWLRDVVLVDKVRFVLAEPRRWDLAAFRFPLRQTSLHVKRIVGLPGDHLRIAGGNLWQVEAGVPRRIHRKPPELQARAWREIYPMRRCLQPQATPLGEYFEGRRGAWRADGEDLVVTPAGGPATLTFTNPTEGGLADRLYDGYPPDVALRLYERAGRGVPFEGVQDARLSFSVTAATLATLRVTLTISQPGRPPLALRATLSAADGGVLSLHEAGREVRRHAFACRLPAATPTTVSFAHVDGTLVARCGDAGAELDTDAFERSGPLRPQDLALEIELEGVGEMRLSALRVERDVHYLADGLIGAEHTELVVPAGHYFLLGDNPRESTDGRGWRGVDLGWRGALTPPANPGGPPGSDDNPLTIDDRRLLFTDVHGNVHVMAGRLMWNSGADGPRLTVRPAGAPPAQPPQFVTRFVPRAALIGRPFLAGIVDWRWLR